MVPSTGDFRLPNNPFLWRGTCHHSGAAAAAQQLLAHQGPDMALLYVWGHSWKLDGGAPNNSWSYIEAVCKTLGGKSDVWYAGNAEVADYLAALRKVELALTGDPMFNASSSSVWVKQGGQAVELKPQATLPLPAPP